MVSILPRLYSFPARGLLFWAEVAMNPAPLLVVLLASPPASQDPQFYQDVARFEQHWVRFVNGMAGCPPDSLLGYAADCVAERRHFNAKEYALAREMAKRVFGLGEKR